MSESVDDLVLSARGLLPLRAAFSALSLAVAVAALPNLEDAGLLALMVLGASGCAAALSVLVGGVWTFDAKDLPEARERARTVFEVGGFAAGAFCLALLTQASYAPAWWPGWGYAVLCSAAWLAWSDMPWTALEARLAARRGPAAFDRYRVAEEAAPPAPAAPKDLPPGVEAMLVSSGSFRVDRARMLKVLSGYQLADPSSFLLPWLRLAVASGATGIELTSRPDGLELRFGGKPLGSRFLDDPYLALLGDEDEDGERHKHLAYGLLGLLALTPRAVLGVSGTGGAVLRVEPEGAAAMEPPAPDLEGRTVLRVVFDGWSARLRALEALAKARSSWGLADARLVVDGKAVPGWELESGKGRRFEEQGAAGLVYGREGLASRLRIYSLGVVAGEKDFYPRDAQGAVSVHASYAKLRLDASQGKVVEDSVFAEFMNRMQAACRGRAPAAAGKAQLPAYSKSGLAAALAGSACAFALFAAAADRRPDLAWASGVLYAGVTGVLLAFLARWAAARLSGRRNPFRP